MLDTASREDESRVRKGLGDENLAIWHCLALSLVRQETTSDEDYLLKALGNS